MRAQVVRIVRSAQDLCIDSSPIGPIRGYDTANKKKK
jgi:hypothetical protein